MRVEDLDTPAVICDLEVMERNIAAMAARCREIGIPFRAHTKSHKNPEIAHRQVASGAIGICCQKLGEAEVMVQAGIRGHPDPVQHRRTGEDGAADTIGKAGDDHGRGRFGGNGVRDLRAGAGGWGRCAGGDRDRYGGTAVRGAVAGGGGGVGAGAGAVAGDRSPRGDDLSEPDRGEAVARRDRAVVPAGGVAAGDDRRRRDRVGGGLEGVGVYGDAEWVVCLGRVVAGEEPG